MVLCDYVFIIFHQRAKRKMKMKGTKNKIENAYNETYILQKDFISYLQWILGI